MEELSFDNKGTCVFCYIPFRHTTLLSLVNLFRLPKVSVAYLTVNQPDLESRFLVSSQLGSSIQSGSSPSVGLQVVTQSTHLSKDCYPQLVQKPHCSEIPRKATIHLLPSFVSKLLMVWEYYCGKLLWRIYHSSLIAWLRDFTQV